MCWYTWLSPLQGMERHITGFVFLLYENMAFVGDLKLWEGSPKQYSTRSVIYEVVTAMFHPKVYGATGCFKPPQWSLFQQTLMGKQVMVLALIGQ